MSYPQVNQPGYCGLITGTFSRIHHSQKQHIRIKLPKGPIQRQFGISLRPFFMIPSVIPDFTDVGNSVDKNEPPLFTGIHYIIYLFL